MDITEILNEKIFVQIASYRDSQLIPTIKSCLENADKPELIHFGICWQHDETEDLSEYLSNPNFKIISIHYTQTLGCCWARNKVQQLYTDEEYTLQLDSHHRFVKGWDTLLKDMYEKLILKGISKPLITAYLPNYNPEKDPEERVMTPLKIDFKEITRDSQTIFVPKPLDNYLDLTEPVEARFFSAHFVFTSGEFIKEVPYDPELYFIGEEMSITVRAFTHGYSLFHPHILIAWHEYTRKYRPKQWDDDSDWLKKDIKSKTHYLDIFTDFGTFGIGRERTIQDYINYSGIDFLPKKTNKEKKINELDALLLEDLEMN